MCHTRMFTVTRWHAYKLGAAMYNSTFIASTYPADTVITCD